MLKALLLLSLKIALSLQVNRGVLLWSDEFDYIGAPRSDDW